MNGRQSARFNNRVRRVDERAEHNTGEIHDDRPRPKPAPVHFRYSAPWDQAPGWRRTDAALSLSACAMLVAVFGGCDVVCVVVSSLEKTLPDLARNASKLASF